MEIVLLGEAEGTMEIVPYNFTITIWEINALAFGEINNSIFLTNLPAAQLPEINGYINISQYTCGFITANTQLECSAEWIT